MSDGSKCNRHFQAKSGQVRGTHLQQLQGESQPSTGNVTCIMWGVYQPINGIDCALSLKPVGTRCFQRCCDTEERIKHTWPSTLPPLRWARMSSSVDFPVQDKQ
jgi:hypothetical protein